MSRPALFLDRDGVINVDHAYVYKQKDFEFIDGIFELCQYANQLGFLICVVTNQAGIGRGYYSENDFLELTNWMCSIFKEKKCAIDKVYFCPTHPVHGIGKYKTDSYFRKPNPGMILEAKHEFEINLEKSILIGDKETDILAGISAGIKCNLLYCSNSNSISNKTAATATIPNLSCALPFFKPE